jgi:2,3-bisphosphoglycerate-independent phosphoglycerate mutase
MDSQKKAILIILDGWGISPDPNVSAIAQAYTPFVDKLLAQYPNSRLTTFGADVGLPDGQMGNSEVGHLNIGAGRIVYQELARINKYILDDMLITNEKLIGLFDRVTQRKKSIHILGLVSDGGVHSHINHLKSLCFSIGKTHSFPVYLHAFLDGRDTDPRSGLGYLSDLQPYLDENQIELATVIGRYYAMDRDKRWERIRKAYTLLVDREGIEVSDPYQTILQYYQEGITDEFMPPMYMQKSSFLGIQEGDILIFFNFRTDRLRELVYVLSQGDMPAWNMKKLELELLTFTRYDETFEKVEVLFEKDDLPMTLGEVLALTGKTQLRIAETEKYPHVTYFFSGGREIPFDGEQRIMIPSPKVTTYDLQPEMSAYEVTEKVMAAIEESKPDFIVLNFANTDMVGHTGVFEAGIKAAEAVDSCLAELIPLALEQGYDLIIIADHGNADNMINPDGSPNTAHSTNPVPCIYVSDSVEGKKIRDGRLADIAPTILAIMGIEIPKEMDGDNLIGG